MYKIKLSDGTEITNLKVNGDYFVSQEKLTEDDFKGKLSNVEITGENESEFDAPLLGTYKNLILVSCEYREPLYMPEFNGYWIYLRERTPQELKEEILNAKIEYVAMMTDIEI